MIQVTIYQKASGQYAGFQMEGHADFAAYGKDIVCAAVSVLVINTVNSIEAFTEDTFSYREEKDVVSFEITSCPMSNHTELLLKSLVLGLTGIEEEYGKKFIQVKIKRKQEV